MGVDSFVFGRDVSPVVATLDDLAAISSTLLAEGPVVHGDSDCVSELVAAVWGHQPSVQTGGVDQTRLDPEQLAGLLLNARGIHNQAMSPLRCPS